MRECTLESITTGIFDGKHGGCKEVPGTGYYFVSVKDLTEYGIDYSGAKEISEEQFNEIYYRTSLENGDVIYANTGDTIGKCAFIANNSLVEKTSFQKSVAVLKPDRRYVHDRFLYYLMKYETPGLREAATGSAQKNLLLSTMRNYKVLIPDMEEQIKISSILGCIDDKIKINILLNENMIRQVLALYQEMFGSKSDGYVKITDKRIGEVLKPGIASFEGEKTYIATADITGQLITNVETKITFEKRPSRANMQPCLWSLWFAKMKNSPKLYFINDSSYGVIENFIFSTGFYGIKAKEKYFYYLWAFLSTKKFDDLKNMFSNGTTMQALNNDGLSKIEIYLPEDSEIERFNTFAEPMFNQIQFNCYVNRRLCEMRDTIMPHLMNGKLDISSIK